MNSLVNSTCDGTIEALAEGPMGPSSGSLFASAVSTLLATQCAIANPYQWPSDRTEDALKGILLQLQYTRTNANYNFKYFC